METDGGRSDLVAAALARIGGLERKSAKEAAVVALARALGEIASDAEHVAGAFAEVLRISAALPRGSAPAAFGACCAAIASASLPRIARGELLERALAVASRIEETPARIECSRGALDAMVDLVWGEEVAQRLEELAVEATKLADEAQRTPLCVSLAVSLARARETASAVRLLERVPASATRARALALVAAAGLAAGDEEDAVALVERALAEVRSAGESSDQAAALAALQRVLLETGLEGSSGDLLAGAIDGVDAIVDPSLQREALIGAIDALPASVLEPSRLTDFVARLSISVARVARPRLRGELLGRLAVALARTGDVAECESALRQLVTLTRGGPEPGLEDGVGDLPASIPFSEVVGALVDAGAGDDRLQELATTALDLFAELQDAGAEERLLRQFARLFASPALPYERRVWLLDRALAVARRIPTPDQRVGAATAIANALSLTGAMERGDAFFAGLVTGAEPALARRAHLERAVALVRLNRTADALAELAAAATPPAGGVGGAIQLARAAARCGFVADALAELAQLDTGERGKACAQVADALAESSYLDPNIRVLGLDSLAKMADEPAATTIACLTAQVRLHEGIGAPVEVLTGALARAAALDKDGTRAIVEEQLVFALIERIGRLASR